MFTVKAQTVNIHADLIERALHQDEAAQFELYKKYSAAMYNTALRIVKNTALAEDVLQEAFLSAFQSLVFYRGEASFGSWLKRIVVNKAISANRKESRIEFTDEPLSLEQVQESEEPDYDVDSVKRAIEKLPTGFRTVLTLYLLEGYDHKEIAEILDITESTSKTQYKRAKDKLKEILRREEYDGKY